MGRLLDRLRRDDPTYLLEVSDDGFALTPRDGQEQPFNVMARDLINDAGTDFVVFPSTDGHNGYDRVFLIPLP